MLKTFGKRLKLNVYTFLIAFLSLYLSVQSVYAATTLVNSLSALTEGDYAWIGAKLYQNEAASNPKYLTHWGQGEDFPSFGIAHFIWFPAISPPPYQETFPEMFEFVSKKSSPPLWLQKLWQQSISTPNLEFDAPWQNKAQFDARQSTPELQSLRQWLLNTQAHQARFVGLAFQQRWVDESESLATERLNTLTERLAQMMAFKQGLFSVIDYFNFKGLGNNSKEQYQGKSWGLISVLEGMPEAVFDAANASDAMRLAAFIQSAKTQLQQRVNLAPSERNEARWIKGWFKRLEGYAVP